MKPTVLATVRPRSLPPLRNPRAFIAHYVRGRPWHFAGLAVAVIGAAVTGVSVQYVMKLLVDAMADPARVAGPAWRALGLFIGLIAVESVLWRASGWLGCRTTVGVGVDMRLDLFRHLARQPMRYFADNLAGALGQRITATAGNLGALTNTITWRIAPPCIDFLGALIVFTTVNGGMAAGLAAFVIVMTTALIVFGERGRPRHRAFAHEAGIAAGEIVDTIANMWAVKAFSAQRREWLRLAGRFRVEARAQRQSWMYTEKTRVIHDIGMWTMAAAMLGWALRLWQTGTITPGSVVVISALTFRILHGSRDLALALVDAAQQFGFIEDTLKVIGQPPTVIDVPHAPPMTARGGRIEFRNVRFAYGAHGDAIHDLSLSIPAGQKIGIVGPSGAGKSTLVQLLQRLYEVQGGEILIDDQPVHRVAQDSLRQAIAVVPQEIVLFHRSVMENIRFGRPDASDEEVFEAARAAACDSFIRRLSDGYDTLVGERGVKLSGGQRQRIGIARAFLKDAPILLFDEATSALDTESELAIHRALVNRMRHRTVIAVAHRLSTLSNFDRVIVVDQGRIVEDGRPGDLLRRNGPFARMWRLQAGGFEDAEVRPLLADVV